MRVLALLSLLACSLLVVSGATPPDTPPDGVHGHPYCTLADLEFTNGLKLIGQFKGKDYHYECSCADLGSPFSTQVIPTTEDPGSSAEIFFNGVAINTRAMHNAISNDGTVPDSPLTMSSPLQFVVGWNTIIIGVACNERVPCYYQYNVTCELPPPTITGDPQFVGLRGQQYQVHGVSGEIYNIVSDTDLQYNARFVFLDEGECPVVNGRKQKGCFSHPGSYLGEIGIKTRSGDRIHLRTGPAKTGFEAVMVNDQTLEEGDTVLLADDMGSVSRNSTHLATVNVGDWQFAFENSDLFVNQRVRVRDARKLRAHGLLGQTWRDQTYPNPIKYIAGVVDDYVIRDRDIFGDNFVFNTFN